MRNSKSIFLSALQFIAIFLLVISIIRISQAQTTCPIIQTPTNPVCGDSCTLNLQTCFTTDFSGGGGSFSSSPSQGSSSVFSPTNTIANDNAGFGPNFLTCPATPPANPTTNVLFYANDGSYVAGDECLAPTTTIATTLTLPTQVNLNQPGGLATSTVGLMQISDPGNLMTQVISYSPTVDNGLSNGFDTTSYIFSGVPSEAQHSIWSWDLEFAEFANAQTQAPLPISETYSSTDDPLISETGLIFTIGVCTYTYDYAETTTLTSIDNNYIPFNEVVPNSITSAGTDTSGPTFSGSITPNSFNTLSFNSLVYPALLYNSSINIASLASASNPNLVGIGEDIFSPWNYYTPSNSIDEFPINLTNDLLVNYSSGTGNFLSSISENSFGINGNALETPAITMNSLLGPQNAYGLCSSGGTLSYGQLEECAQIAGFTPGIQADTIVAIAEAESQGNSQYAQYQSTTCPLSSAQAGTDVGENSMSVGILGYQTCYEPTEVSCTGQTFSSCSGAATDVYQSFVDAFSLSNSGQDFSPWCVYDAQGFGTTGSGQYGCGGSYTNAFCQYVPKTESPGTQDCSIGTCDPTVNAQPGCYGSANSVTLANALQEIQDPISIAGTPSDYYFVLYQSGCTAAQGFSGCNSAYSIATVRLYPHGYVNPTSIPANIFTTCDSDSESSCQTQWNTIWSAYWDLVINEQNNTAYVVNTMPLSGLTYSSTGNLGSQYSGTIVPYNITTDDAGDLYIVGSTVIGDGHSAVVVKIANVLTNGVLCTGSSCWTTSENAIQTQVGNKNLFASSSSTTDHLYTEIAASPEPGTLYFGSPASGCINVYGANDLNFLDAIPLAYGQYPTVIPTTQTQSGLAAECSTYGFNTKASNFFQTVFGTQYPNIPLLNIASWLNSNGLFGQNVFGGSYSGNMLSYLNLDIPSNHHPLALADPNGYLYVLDDWNGTICGSSSTSCSTANSKSSGGLPFNIVILRVLNSTGTDAPIVGSQVNDVYAPMSCSSSQTSASGWLQQNGGNACLTTAQVDSSSWCGSGADSGGKSTCCPSTCHIAESLGSYFACGSNYNPLSLTPVYEWQCQSNQDIQSNVYYSLATAGNPNNAYPPYGWIISARVGGGTSYQFCNLASCTTSKTYNAVGPKLLSGISTVNAIGVSMSVTANGTIAILFPGSNVNGLFNYQDLIFARFNVENYTNYLQGAPQYLCYTASLSLNHGACQVYSGIANVMSPVYLTDNPFLYLENQGSEKTLAFANEYYSLFSGGNGQPASVGGLTQNCENQLGSFNVPTNCGSNTLLNSLTTGNFDIGGQTGNTLTNSLTVSNGIVSVPVLSSYVGGQGYIGFKYTYTLDQTWSSIDLIIGSFPPCVAAIPDIDVKTTTTVYDYANSIPSVSNTLSANVAGGDTYLQFVGGGDYVPNLSSAGLYLSHHILAIVSNNRRFGAIYVGNASAGSDNYNLLNATQQLQYFIQTYTCSGCSATLQYETITSDNSIGQLYYPSTPSEITPLTNANPPANAFLFNENFSSPPDFGSTHLFDWYKQETYQAPLFLYTENAIGYQRILYSLNDTFGNNIFVPIDADIANITLFNIHINPQVNLSNVNQTTIVINGTLGTYDYPQFNSLNSYFVPLNGPIYIYFQQNINYESLSGSGSTLAQQQSSCAYANTNIGYNTIAYPSSCILANPDYSGLQTNANTIEYAPMTNSNGACQSPPNSLLTVANVVCNIYGSDGNTMHTFSNPNCNLQVNNKNNQQGYCEPLFVNGSGICTSQLGLANIIYANSLGAFSTNIIACGIGQINIEAAYYGTPGQPISATQSYLPQAANSILNPDSAPTTTFNTIGYYWTPNETVILTSIGLFELNFGDIDFLGITIALAAAVILILYGIHSNGGKGNRKISRK
jgi:hypothetical protein